MADMTMPTILDTNGFGGMGTGAGFIGGLILGSLWNGNGNGFGFGGNNNGANAFVASQLNDGLNRISEQVTQGNLSAVEQGSNQNMFLGNLVNQTGDAITGAITQGTISGLQNSQILGDKLCCINNNITSQGYENRLQAQALAAQLQNQHADLSRQIFEENCKDRELQREIQTQAVRDKLTEVEARNAALEAQINLTNQLTAQTAYLVQQLKPAATTAGA